MANALPKWKAFAWGAMPKDLPSKRRACLSMAILNIAPAIVYVTLLYLLSARIWDLREWNLWSILLIGVLWIPALTTFGFYKVWMGIVQKWSDYFYGCGEFRRKVVDPGLGPENLKPEYGLGNIKWGALYLITGVGIPLGISLVGNIL